MYTTTGTADSFGRKLRLAKCIISPRVPSQSAVCLRSGCRAIRGAATRNQEIALVALGARVALELMRRLWATGHAHDVGLSHTKCRGKMIGECTPWWGVKAHRRSGTGTTRLVHNVNIVTRRRCYTENNGS